jgi:hypothetical protein
MELNTTSPEEVIYTIENCARCGQTHPVTFKKLTNPPTVYDPYIAYARGDNGGFGIFKKVTVSHYGICPVNGEPILMNTR